MRPPNQPTEEGLPVHREESAQTLNEKGSKTSGPSE